MHDQESSFRPKLTMQMNFFCQMLSISDKQIRISNFHFVCELLPFVKELFLSDENNIIIALSKKFHMI